MALQFLEDSPEAKECGRAAGSIGDSLFPKQDTHREKTHTAVSFQNILGWFGYISSTCLGIRFPGKCFGVDFRWI